MVGILDLYLTLVGNSRASSLSTMKPEADTTNSLTEQSLKFPSSLYLKKKRKEQPLTFRSWPGTQRCYSPFGRKPGISQDTNSDKVILRT